MNVPGLTRKRERSRHKEESVNAKAMRTFLFVPFPLMSLIPCERETPTEATSKPPDTPVPATEAGPSAAPTEASMDESGAAVYAVDLIGAWVDAAVPRLETTSAGR